MTDEELKARIEKHEAKVAKLATPDWDRFRGNNHEMFDRQSLSCGGPVSFTRHIGKPLSPELWKDLMLRLCLPKLRVYAYRSEQWTDGKHSTAVVYLDANDLVRDIEITL